ncbi:MAG: sulfatase-like hydrolase/transferase [Verrucomicrobia bacterium]|nr:sulfatase-like hydrolase/transferase [Verrucomicrobiota bacterium]
MRRRPGNGYFDPVIRHNGRFAKTQGYCTDVFFRQAQHWITSRKAAHAPFFAYLTPNAPHDPSSAPARTTNSRTGTGASRRTPSPITP